jgi:flagellar basal-body rod protein FlgB
MIGDTTIDALRVGLNGLNLRRQATEDAVANMETPGYTANRVDFEDQLASAIDSGDPSSVTPTITKSTAPALPNGNNVQVDQELMGLSETELRQQLLVEAVNAKFRLLRTVIVG